MSNGDKQKKREELKGAFSTVIYFTHLPVK